MRNFLHRVSLFNMLNMCSRYRFLPTNRLDPRKTLFNILNTYSILGTEPLFGLERAPCQQPMPTPQPPSNAPSTFSKPSPIAAMDSPIPKSAASSVFPKALPATFCALWSGAAISRRDADTGRYRLGLKILSLGGDAQSNLDIADVALPFMRSLVERVHLTVHLAVLDQGEAVYIEKVEAPGFFKVNTWVGRRMFLHSTSVGKCLLAWLPKQEDGNHRETARTEKAHAENHHTHCRACSLIWISQADQGYAVDDEENSLGAAALVRRFLTPRET